MGGRLAAAGSRTDAACIKRGLVAVDTSTMMDQLKADLELVSAELARHLATPEYAWAMGMGCSGGREHPLLQAAYDRAEALQRRCGDLRARLAEWDA